MKFVFAALAPVIFGLTAMACPEEHGAPMRQYCKDTYKLVDKRTGQELNTFPARCEDALKNSRNGFFCKDTYKLVEIRSGEESNTFPARCDEALSSSRGGFYCKDTYTLVNMRTGETQNTFPKRCSEI